MKTPRILLLALLGLCLAGCKSGKGNQELLERELRCQEDHIYELENALDECECELESVRRENQTLKRDGSAGPQGSGGSSNVPIIDLPSDSGPAPRRRIKDAEPTLPKVEGGEEFIPSPSGSDSSAHPEPSDRRIARIVLNKQLTGGLNHHGQGADEGILVVFEPRNARGELVAEPGDVSIALVDPQRSGPEARIARWDFSARDAFQQFHRSGALGRGYEFELPWPAAVPQNRKLELFVRYVTPDGRKLLSEMPIQVDPPGGNQARRWRAAPGRMADQGWSDAPLDQRPVAQNSGGRRRPIWAGSESGSRDSEAPGYGPTDSSAASPVEMNGPSIELGSEESSADEADEPVAADEKPAAVARRSGDDRQSRRPNWTPYR